jgi:MbtH protein
MSVSKVDKNLGENPPMEYIVVVNQERQYSIWASGEPLPPGWNNVGKRGSKEECLGYIEENWIDMRPASLRNQMDQEK